MYASNQKLDITCEPMELPMVLDFAVRLYGKDIFTRRDGRIRMAWSGPAASVYALGLGSMEPYTSGPNKGWARTPGNGWTDYPFDYDPEIVARVAAQWLEKHPPDNNAAPARTGLPSLRSVSGPFRQQPRTSCGFPAHTTSRNGRETTASWC